ncbi:transglutaminase domain-containing protein [Actinoplanes sp. TBRC 11911]|uniref:transglutaminase domain-containing protein n=1 Tax=Actinoplanes sp. TBRC 11911 TaxID=2729386 RepID=UPI00145ECE9C|nr:transglutaminase domain-containing protein [Actinoplanes sp. TBRC 11911]NMO54944.1 transglutaminase domain-containing protein [Actinoplanes sp. TBRC 11911]
MTGVGGHADAVARLPGDFTGIAAILHGLLIHEFWADAYGVTLSDADRETVHLRPADKILDAVLAKDPRPFDVAREPEQRVATNCRGFTVVSVALLRAHGVPARARCGFGAYFREGWFEDHWVVEYHDGERWRRGDAQIDGVQGKALGIDFDLSDVGDRFVVAGEAMRLVKAGGVDASRFGLSTINEGGEDWIAGNVARDELALAGVEVLPWDTWEGPGIPEEVFNELRKRSEVLR